MLLLIKSSGFTYVVEMTGFVVWYHRVLARLELRELPVSASRVLRIQIRHSIPNH